MHRSRSRAPMGAVVLFALLPAAAALAQYSGDSAAPMVVLATGTDDVQPKFAAAPGNGVYVSMLSGSGYDVRLARLNEDGSFAWKSQSVLVEDRTNSSTTDYGLASDAQGNAFVSYEVGTTILLASYDSSGNLRWKKTVSGASGGSVGRVAVASDGYAWCCFIEGSATRVQRFDTDGNPMLGAGVLLNESGASMFSADIQPSVDGAVLVSCVRYTTFTGAKILRAHRVNSDGSKPWASVGVSVFTTGSLQFGNFPPFLPDGEGGAYFCWYTSSPLQSWLQRINASGALQYGTNGVAVTATTTGAERVSPTMTLGSDGRAYVFWSQHTPNSSIYGTYGQCFAGGVRQWGDSGAAVAPLATVYSRTWATAARMGDSIACFYDDSPSGTQDNIRCAKMTSKGTVAWTKDIAVSTGVKYRLASAPAVDASLLTWQGGITTGASDVFAARIDVDGVLGPPVGGVPGDLNDDGIVNAADLAILLGSWGTSGPGDLNGDGTVNAADLSILLSNWS